MPGTVLSFCRLFNSFSQHPYGAGAIINFYFIHWETEALRGLRNPLKGRSQIQEFILYDSIYLKQRWANYHCRPTPIYRLSLYGSWAKMVFTFLSGSKKFKTIVFHDTQKCWETQVSVSIVLFEHSQAHSRLHCLWLLSHDNVRVSWNRDWVVHKI